MRKLGLYILGFAALCCMLPCLFAQVRTPVAYWLSSGGSNSRLQLNLVDYATDKQRKLIDSGFTTYSEISIVDIKGAPKLDLDEHPIKMGCTVKYDAWEERYEVTRIEKGAQTVVVSKFADYANHCLTLAIEDGELNQQLQNGTTIVLKLQMNQVSPEKTQEIKKWLVRQQSGVMQGIFSHMLGDLKLSENVSIKVVVPRMNTADAR